MRLIQFNSRARAIQPNNAVPPARGCLDLSVVAACCQPSSGLAGQLPGLPRVGDFLRENSTRSGFAARSRAIKHDEAEVAEHALEPAREGFRPCSHPGGTRLANRRRSIS